MDGADLTQTVAKGGAWRLPHLFALIAQLSRLAVRSCLCTHLTVNESDAVLMSGKCAHRPRVIFSHGRRSHTLQMASSPPENRIWELTSAKNHRIHIILMGLNLGRKEGQNVYNLFLGLPTSQGPGGGGLKSREQYLKGPPVLFSIKTYRQPSLWP